CDVIGLFDQDYRWHDRAQVWATPGAGEDAIAAMIDPPVTERAAALVKRGMHQDVALPVAEGQNAAMGECILRLYRDAAQPAMAELGRNLERAGARPGLSIIATEDHLVGTDEQRRRASARAGAAIAELDGTGPLVVYARPTTGRRDHQRLLGRSGTRVIPRLPVRRPRREFGEDARIGSHRSRATPRG
ncbi:MAG: hypothetical protein WCD33_29020, partial [Mycobacterium sp.]